MTVYVAANEDRARIIVNSESAFCQNNPLGCVIAISDFGPAGPDPGVLSDRSPPSVYL
jgi:hypothetical protein